MNRTILITGCTGLIGQALTKSLLSEGFDVIGTGRSVDRLKSIELSLPTAKGQFIGITSDLTGQGASQKLVDDIKALKLNPWAIIHNARSKEFLEVPADGISRRETILNEYNLDVVVPYETTMLAAKEFSTLQRVLIISSIYGIRPFKPQLYDNPIAATPIQYSLAKAAQIHLARELAVRLSSKKIQVNSVSYGGVLGRSSEEFNKRYREQCLLKGLLDVNDVVAPVLFALTEPSGALTGQNIVLDGGWTAW